MAKPPVKKRSTRKKASAKKSSKKKSSTKKKASGHSPSKRQTTSIFWPRVRRAILWSGMIGFLTLSVYVVYLNSIVQEKFSGNRWSLPARVYAQPLELYQGLAMTPAVLVDSLKRIGYQSSARVTKPGQYLKSRQTVWVQTRGFRFWDGEEASLPLKIEFENGHISNVSHTGQHMAWDIVRLEPELIGKIHPAQYEDRLLLQYKKIPKRFVDMLIAVEDKRFFQHWGVDFRGLARAMWVNVRAGQFKQGGSTLTQQLAKNFFLTPERSLIRKFNEVLYSGLMEWHYDKTDIIEAYCNQVFVGQHGARAIHGFQLASQYYFGRRLEQLDIAQMAMLVGMVKGPSRYHPVKHPQRAKKRRAVVLKLLVEQSVITDKQAKIAAKKPLPKRINQQLAQSQYPAFLSLVKRQLKRDYSEKDLKTAGLSIFTTLLPAVQRASEQAVMTEMKVLEKQYKLPKGKLQSAVMVVSPQEGEVLAVVGGRNPKFQGFNRALDAFRAIGSLIKPAVYLTALQRPDRYTLTTPIFDQAIEMTNNDGSLWRPKNYDNMAHGRVPLFKALANSYNLATIRLGLDIGVESVILSLRKLGAERPIKPYPSMLLGTPEMSPYEVAQMYQTFASGGYYAPLRAIRSVLDAQNQPLSRYPLAIEKRFDAGAVILINRAMQAVIDLGSARAVRHYVGEKISLAGKTGTTNQGKDSWFAGFGGDKVGVVWVGFDDNKPTKLSGSRGALKVWGRIMQKVGLSNYSLPSVESVHWVAVDPNQNLKVNDSCDDKISFPYIIGSEPTDFAPCAEKAEDTWFQRWFD